MTPVNRVRAFFFVQFMSLGMVNAFGGPWLDSLGLSEQQIGVIYAVPLALMVVLTVPAGRLADKASDWRDVIRIGMVAAALAPIGFYFVNGFTGILIVWTLATLFQALLMPVIDGAGIRFGRRNGQTLGSFRALTTFGYLLIILAVGPLLETQGIGLYLPILIALCAIRGLAALSLPHLRASETETPAKAPIPLTELRQRWFWAPCLGAAILLATVFVLNGFQSLLWAQQGLPASWIGALISLGAASEALLFLFYRHVSKLASPVRLLLFAAICTVIRWALLGFELPIWALIPVQLMHALTFAIAFLASANFIADYTGEDIAASAQAVIVMVYQAIAVVLLPGFGWIAGQAGTSAYFALAAVAGIAAILIATAPKPQIPQISG